jgi:SAM-dependent methyltransferase
MGKARAVLRRLRQTGWRLEDLGRHCLCPFRAAAVHHPLPPEGCRASLDVRDPVGVLERGAPFRCLLHVGNRGSHLWSSRGAWPVYVSVRWLTRDGRDVGLGEMRFPLPGTLGPGAATLVKVRLHAPESLGDYLLELDLVQGPASRFADQGSVPVCLPCRVTGRRGEDIDYLRWYRTRDLRRDYWTVVGPTTRREYERLGAIKLKLLTDLGLRPDARVLDIGCGTGQLTAALEGFLSDAGLYYGTDVAPEAVAFCRARFRRPNFAFLTSGMTSVPLAGVCFDYAVFYSVFTHTFPDETVLLLREAARLLALGGVIFADLFTSPLVARRAGNRGAVEVNPDYFLGLVADCRLRAEQVLSHPWGAFGQRMFFRISERA